MTKEVLPPELVIALRQAIQRSGQSLNQLSTTCGIDRGRLSRFMRGERDLTLHAGGRLCEALGIHFALPKTEDLERAGEAEQMRSGKSGQMLSRTASDNASTKLEKPSRPRGRPRNAEGDKPKKGKGAK